MIRDIAIANDGLYSGRKVSRIRRKKAKERQREAGRSSAPGRPAEKGTEIFPEVSARSTDEVAEQFGSR